MLIVSSNITLFATVSISKASFGQLYPPLPELPHDMCFRLRRLCSLASGDLGDKVGLGDMGDGGGDEEEEETREVEVEVEDRRRLCAMTELRYSSSALLPLPCEPAAPPNSLEGSSGILIGVANLFNKSGWEVAPEVNLKLARDAERDFFFVDEDGK